MKRTLLFLFGITLSLCIYAQKEANNWFFGMGAGMTWNTTRSFTAKGLFGTPDKSMNNMPTDLGTTSISTAEGCFSLSDASGKVVCYSDGITVWDTNGNPMPNGTGLNGGSSAAQSGILLPYPGAPKKYIIVSIGSENASPYYSVLDMTLNGGLGDIVATQKNILLAGASGTLGETITSIKHQNGRDYWIVAPGRATPGVLNAWLVDNTGVHASAPQKITTLPVGLTGYGQPSGYMKFAPDGKHFAMSTGRSRYLIVGFFDTQTGEFKNLKAWTSSRVGAGGPYGTEFSQSGKIVYMTDFQSLFVFKFSELMSATDPLTIVPKEYLSLQAASGIVGAAEASAIQLGPDNRLYIVSHSNFLYFVDNPEEYDNLRIYITDQFLTGNGLEGLPSFVASYFSLDGDRLFCMNTTKEFTVSVPAAIGTKLVSHTKWDFGDGTGLVELTGNGELKQSHIYARPGDYTITVSAYDNTDELLGSPTTINIKVSSCVMPVNPNIHFNNQ